MIEITKDWFMDHYDDRLIFIYHYCLIKYHPKTDYRFIVDETFKCICGEELPNQFKLLIKLNYELL